MNILKIILLFGFISPFCAEPITIGLAGTIVFGAVSYIFQRDINCLLTECCEPKSKWLPMNISKLRETLKYNLHGQHLVEIALLRHLQSHVNNENPSKALLFSFNGMPGTGKNFVTVMIANSLFKNGMKSKNVHMFMSSLHFPLEKLLDDYKLLIHKKIIEAVKQCPRSLFIFDEVQDMPGNLLDSIKPFVDGYESIDGVDFRKTIFILLSNSGGRDINNKLIQANNDGIDRNKITLKDMEQALALNLYKMNNDGLRKSKLISHNLITAFVPFLPLEKQHVILCIKSSLKLKGIHDDEELIDKIMDELNFSESNGLTFAKQGCKRIEDKLQLFL